MDEIDYVVMTAGGFDLLCEVVCEGGTPTCSSWSPPRIRTGAGRAVHRDLHDLKLHQADLLLGCALTGPNRDYRTPSSLWHATAADDFAPRPSLPGPASYDVAIVGAGLTGLWTAYYLRRADPGLRVVVLEAEVAGFGASGRNGGWCSALFPASWARAGRRDSSEGDALRLHRGDAGPPVHEVGRVVEMEGIEAHYHRGGTVTLARRPCPAPRGPGSRCWIAHARGFTEEDERLLEPDEASAMLAANARPGRGRSRRTVPCCIRRIWCVASRGPSRRAVCSVFEQTTVRGPSRPAGSRPRSARCAQRWWCVRPRATPPDSEGLRRAIVPVYSLMVATEPLARRRGIRSARPGTALVLRRPAPDHLRPTHRRRAVGVRRSRGAVPLRVPHPSVVRRLAAGLRGPAPMLRQMLPQLQDTSSPTSGAVASASPATGPRRSSSTAAPGSAGRAGASGDGVGSNLAGRTLADLVTGADDDIGHPSLGRAPQPPGNPSHCAGSASTRACARSLADVEERLTRRESVVARVIAPLTGGH